MAARSGGKQSGPAAGLAQFGRVLGSEAITVLSARCQRGPTAVVPSPGIVSTSLQSTPETVSTKTIQLMLRQQAWCISTTCGFERAMQRFYVMCEGILGLFNARLNVQSKQLRIYQKFRTKRQVTLTSVMRPQTLLRCMCERICHQTHRDVHCFASASVSKQAAKYGCCCWPTRQACARA